MPNLISTPHAIGQDKTCHVSTPDLSGQCAAPSHGAHTCIHVLTLTNGWLVFFYLKKFDWLAFFFLNWNRKFVGNELWVLGRSTVGLVVLFCRLESLLGLWGWLSIYFLLTNIFPRCLVFSLCVFSSCSFFCSRISGANLLFIFLLWFWVCSFVAWVGIVTLFLYFPCVLGWY